MTRYLRSNVYVTAFILSISLVACGGGGSSSNASNSGSTGSIDYILQAPSDISVASNSMLVQIETTTGTSIGTQTSKFGQASSFSNLAPGAYVLTTSGVADAISGVYYAGLNMPTSATSGSTTNLGNVFLSQVTSQIVPATLKVSGLQGADTATVIISDGGKYIFDSFSVGNGNNQLKLPNGDNITVTLTFSSHYIPVAPIQTTVSNNQELTVVATPVETPTPPNYTGSINYSIIQPPGINSNSTVVHLLDYNGDLVGSQSTLFGQLSSFNNLAGGVYSLTSNGFANPLSGLYYSPLDYHAVIISGSTTNLGSLTLPKVTSGIVPATIHISGLDSGDTATIDITDNTGRYIFNTFVAANGNESLSFINGESMVFNVTVGSAYNAVAPIPVSITTSAQSIDVTVVPVAVPPPVESNGVIRYSVTKPVGISANSIAVNLINYSGIQVATQSTPFGRVANFNNVESGFYTLTSYGYANVLTGVYYEPLNKAATVTQANTTNLGNLSLGVVNTSHVPVRLNVSGLESGDTAVINLSDNRNQYLLESFVVGNVTESLSFLNGESVVFHVTVNSSYNTVLPIGFTATSGGVVNIAISKKTAPPTTTIFSAYKDVGINMNWWDESAQGGGNTYVMSTVLNGSGPIPAIVTSVIPIVEALPSSVNTVTWAFATGECGSENWAGIGYDIFAGPNVNSFVNAHKNYVLSTGGAAGAFTCSSNAEMKTFIDRYNSPYLLGVDFDIEGYKMTNAQISSLIATIKYAQTQYPNLRISFTLATLADSSGSHAGLNSEGDFVMRTAESMGIDFYVNLMTMDYSNSASSSVCVMNTTTNQCDMALSAIQAVKNLQYTYGTANNRIEVTPLIGEADVLNEVFTIADTSIVAAYVRDNGLAGYHYWSYDRDTACAGVNNSVTTTCNGVPGAAILGYMNAALTHFN